MGSNQSVGCQQIQVNINHPKFKNAKIYRQSSVSKLITQLPIEQSIFKSWKKQLNSHILNTQFLLLPQKYHFENQRFCSSNGYVQIIYQNFPYLLKNEIQDRAGKKLYFSEQQLWFLLFSIYSVKKQFFQKRINNGFIGDISPQNIFLSQKAEIRIGSALSWPGQMQSLRKSFSQENKKYLAPQDFVHISLGMTYCKITNQSQVFAIGLTILSAGILKDNNQLYNFQTKKFNFNQALNRLKIWKLQPQYSDLLKAIVQLLCSFQPKDRLKLNQIWQILNRCSSSIKSKKKFSVYPIAKKIQQKISQNRKANIILPDNINQVRLQKLSPIKIIPVNGVHNELNLTQIILNPALRQYSNQKISQSSQVQSPFSSVDQLNIKRAKSDSKQEKPQFQYQQINANKQVQNSLQQNDYLNLLNFVKQVIVQKPIVVDPNRKSYDIQEQLTPSDSPSGTPSNRSLIQDQKRGFNRQFHTPMNSLHSKEKNYLSRTTLNNLRPNTQFQVSSGFKVKQIKSHDPEADIEGKSEMLRNQSTITMYIPLEGQNLNQSLKSSCESQLYGKKRSSDDSQKKPKPIRIDRIQERSKQGSQIQINQLSQQDKKKIQDEIIIKLQRMMSPGQNVNKMNQKDVNKVNQKEQIKRQVRFAGDDNQKNVIDEQNQLNLSHQSKILQIQDIDLDFLQQNQGINDENERIIVGYRQNNQSQIIVESVKMSKKNSSYNSKKS